MAEPGKNGELPGLDPTVTESVRHFHPEKWANRIIGPLALLGLVLWLVEQAGKAAEGYGKLTSLLPAGRWREGRWAVPARTGRDAPAPIMALGPDNPEGGGVMIF